MSTTQTPCTSLSLEQRVLRMVAHFDDVRLDRELPPRVPGVCQLCGHALGAAFFVTHANAQDGTPGGQQVIPAGSDDAERLIRLGPDGRGELFGKVGAMAVGIYACECMTGHVRDLARDRIAERIRARMNATTTATTQHPDGDRSATMRERVREAKRSPFGRHALSAGVET